MTSIYLNEGEIHLWRLNLENLSPERQEKDRHLLSDDENERAAKFKRGMDDYINSRIFMRNCLSRYLAGLPQDLIFDRTPYGKPFLRGSDLQFNLSHSRQWVVIAIAKQCDLGIDVESISDRRSILNIAQHYFHADEIAQLEKIKQEEDQKEYFFQLWTLKESFLKALGTGISTGLDKINFQINSAIDIHAEFSADLQLKNPSEWQFFQYELNDASVKNWCAVTVRSENKVKPIWM